ncbi:hypothetical protein SAMN02745218_02984 [Desulfofundulus australicus DSM 11792]|uniref:YkgJ family cysteine cluster protein n=1 Tax=Desulfofundulus australicus DSM 11792 TaxID=1121425 RepID=A0A1M5E3L1_9FIRM|nr:YkgJ family cysteine cluster protein [Desulfofundulus australicus]SHF73848.1 hypothetical protein SAMN02745218_02984 [Desulfofundulus australicus DSM 11792]
MVIEIAPEKLKLIAAQKEDENWEFRSFLKTSIAGEEVDSLVHRLYKDISSQVDCKQCANCCRECSPVLHDKDITRLSQGTGIPVSEFIEKYLKKVENDYLFNQKPCPFLKDNLCTQYSYRPGDCRSYPHLHKKGFVFRLIRVIDNYAVCPIVFHVYEELKKELGWKKRTRPGRMPTYG